MKEAKKFDTMTEVPSTKKHFVLVPSEIVLTTFRRPMFGKASSLT
jgi:hypothetical protein